MADAHSTPTIHEIDESLRLGPGSRWLLARNAHVTPDQRLETIIRNHVQHVLAETNENISQAAEILGISRSTLYNWIDRGSTPVEVMTVIAPDESLPPKIEPSLSRPHVTCLRCSLVQFRPATGSCRRCSAGLPKEAIA